MNTGISPKHLLEYVIKPTLTELEMDSLEARLLMLCTGAQESHLGHYLHQIKGPALGIWQIEPKTHIDIYDNYLTYRPELKEKICKFSRFNIIQKREEELITNLKYSCAIARLIYYRVKEPLPDAEDIIALGCYWKNHYNTKNGKGTVDDFVDNYYRYIEGKI